jgi:flagellin FlaB
MTDGATRQSEQQQGITGLETAIILIAFVVVASVFAFTVLSTGIFSAERSKDTIYAGLSEVRSSLATRGSFVAFAGKVSTTQTPYKFSFVISSAVGSNDPIDLTPPYTADGTGTDPDIVSGAAYRLTLNYSDINNFLSDIPWTVSFIGASNSDNLLDDDEKAEITGWILDRNTQTAIGSSSSIAYMDGSGDGGGAGGMTSSDTVLTISDRFTIEIIAEGGAVLAIERRLPDVFKDVMDLR